MAQYVQSWDTRQKQTIILSRWAVGKHYPIHDKQLDSIAHTKLPSGKHTQNYRKSTHF